MSRIPIIHDLTHSVNQSNKANSFVQSLFAKNAKKVSEKPVLGTEK